MPMPRKTDPEKFCAYCGKRLTRKIYNNGKLEAHAFLIRRKYCNTSCSGMAHRKDDLTTDGWRARARQTRQDCCEICGSTDVLCAHHINGDVADNSPDNLMTLCSPCHTKWHWQNGKTPKKRQSVCTVCGDPARRLDMCPKHYMRFRKYGNPNLTKKKFKGGVYRLVWDGAEPPP